jgi:hypothetical protein
VELRIREKINGQMEGVYEISFVAKVLFSIIFVAECFNIALF